MAIAEKIKAAFLKNFGGMGYLRERVNCRRAWYGERYAGFYLNPELLHTDSVVYSFGIGEDISFDEEVIGTIGCEVYGFDPTPKTIEWLGSRNTPEGFHFLPVGIAATTGSMDFYLPKNPSFVSGSTCPHDELQQKIRVPMKTLTDLMEQLGHTHLDLLKMDIEGAEYDVMDHVLSAGISFDQLLIEFHSRFFENGDAKTRAMVERIRSHGYEIFAVSDLLQEVSFIRKELVTR